MCQLVPVGRNDQSQNIGVIGPKVSDNRIDLFGRCIATGEDTAGQMTDVRFESSWDIQHLTLLRVGRRLSMNGFCVGQLITQALAHFVGVHDPVFAQHQQRQRRFNGNRSQRREYRVGPIGFVPDRHVPAIGWIYLVGGIGETGSGASQRANSDTLSLYTIIWNQIANAEAPVAGGRGASAAADFAALKALTMPPAESMVLAVRDDMRGGAANILTG